jgi:Fic family protein
MYQPKFTFTSKIVNNLASIERLYGSILEQELVPSLALKLSQENQVLATHHSTSIEGNPLSPRDVTNIILGDAVPTTKSEKEVANYFATLNKISLMAKKKQEITTDLTLELHKILMQDLIANGVGQFREGEVFIGHKTKTEIVVKHQPPFHSEKQIKEALENLYSWLNSTEELHPLIRAGILHHQFAYIHPFFDGNGRLARILTSYFLLLKKYEVVRFFILDDYYDIDRQQYSDMLHSADVGDKTKWLEYFLEGISYSLQAALARVNEYKRKTIDEVSGEKRVLVTNREEDVISIIIDKKAVRTKDIVEDLGVTRQQAHALLASLVKKGVLQKFGKTKTSYYKLPNKTE